MPDSEDHSEKMRERFEEFTAGPAWRALPLKIKLMLLHIWRRERDVPTADDQ